MASQIEHKSTTTTDQLGATDALQSGSLNGRLYQTLPKSEVQNNSCKFIKERCSLLICGSPYQPLSRREFVQNYEEATVFLAIALCFGGIATIALVSAYTDPSKEISDSVPIRFVCAIVDCIALGAGFLGIRKIYKTCKAPKQEDIQPFLPASNGQNSS